MSILETIFLAMTQGITEWLPVSSSGHLVLFEKWFSVKGASLEFDIFLHLASLVVILLFFKKEVKEVIYGFFNKTAVPTSRKNWLWYIIISSIFTALIGYLFYKQIDYFRVPSQVSNLLLVTSALVLATKFSKGEQNINWRHAVVLGLVQGFAVLPGLSRSGVVIAMAMIMKAKRQQAFDYAFLLAIPAIFGSFILSLGHFDFSWLLLIGFFVTIIVGYLTLALLRFIVNRNNFYLFFIYTLILSLIIKMV